MNETCNEISKKKSKIKCKKSKTVLFFSTTKKNSIQFENNNKKTLFLIVLYDFTLDLFAVLNLH